MKKELNEASWGENELKLALQAEANQYRFASEVSSRAAQCKADIREIVQLAGKILCENKQEHSRKSRVVKLVFEKILMMKTADQRF